MMPTEIDEILDGLTPDERTEMAATMQAALDALPPAPSPFDTALRARYTELVQRLS